MYRPLRKLLNASALVLLMAYIFIGTSVSAQKLIAPTDGATVREAVKIVVDQASVPDGGCISIFVDDRFIGAVAPDEGGTKPLVYYWNSKAEFKDPNLIPADRIIKDGTHVVSAAIYDSSGRMADRIDVQVNLANKVGRLSPNDPIKLVYKYHPGAASVYKVKVESHNLGFDGMPTAGISPMQADYQILQTAEDARRDGSALLSYRSQPHGAFYVQGQGYPLNEGRASGTVYKEVDAFGVVLRDNILARRGRPTIPDVLLQLPRTSIKIGETWNSTEQIRIEGIGDIIAMSCANTLQDLEWEKGQECAKITSVMSGTGRLVAGGNSGPTTVNGEGVFFVGLKTGKMVKSVLTLSANIDFAGAAARAQSGPSASEASDYDDFGEGGASMRPRSGGGQAPSPTMGMDASSSGGSSGPTQIIITTEL